MGFKNAVLDLLKLTHGQTLTTFVEDRGNLSYFEKSKMTCGSAKMYKQNRWSSDWPATVRRKPAGQSQHELLCSF